MKPPMSSKRLRQKAARELEVAIEVLDATGWCKNKLGEHSIDTVDGDGAHCALGALASADSILNDGSGLLEEKVYDPDPDTPYGVAVRAVIDSISQPDRTKYIRGDGSVQKEIDQVADFNRDLGEPVFVWNDEVVDSDPKKGKAQIKRTFRRAIKQLQEA